VTRSIYDNHHFFETDVLGTQVVANAVLKNVKKVDRFIHISTSEVYGTALDATMNEEHPLMPMSPYASAKAGADRLVYSYWATYQIPAVIVRPFNQYGPHQHLEKVIPRFITSCLLDEPIRVHGDGSAARDFTYVEDTCRALDCIAHCDIKTVIGEVINLGYGESLALSELAPMIARKMNKPESLITYVGDSPRSGLPSYGRSEQGRTSAGLASRSELRRRARSDDRLVPSRIVRGGKNSSGCARFPSSRRRETRAPLTYGNPWSTTNNTSTTGWYETEFGARS
jgi:nucleoside-diphosphate-sugar epimerase